MLSKFFLDILVILGLQAKLAVLGLHIFGHKLLKGNGKSQDAVTLQCKTTSTQKLDLFLLQPFVFSIIGQDPKDQQ